MMACMPPPSQACVAMISIAKTTKFAPSRILVYEGIPLNAPPVSRRKPTLSSAVRRWPQKGQFEERSSIRARHAGHTFCLLEAAVAVERALSRRSRQARRYRSIFHRTRGGSCIRLGSADGRHLPAPHQAFAVAGAGEAERSLLAETPRVISTRAGPGSIAWLGGSIIVSGRRATSAYNR